MTEAFSRSDVLYDKASDKLATKTVAVVGLGGVGGSAVEALSRMGVGKLILIDNDVVELTNVNRQLVALHSTIGQYKTQVLKDRILDVNPQASVITHEVFYTDGIELFSEADYVIDCIDTVTSKVNLIKSCIDAGIDVISSMGTGNKKDVTALKVGDVKDTTVCPLARTMRRLLRDKGIEHVKVVWSTEKGTTDVVSTDNGKHAPASALFVPMTAGLMLAQQAIIDLIKN